MISDILDGNSAIAVTRTSFRDEVRMTNRDNIFLHSRILVELPDKYKLCTNRVPVIRGIKETALESAEYYKGLKKKPLTLQTVFVRNNNAIRILVVEPGQADSCSFSSLPNGLSLDGNRLVGSITEDLVGERFKVYNTTLTISRGTETLDEAFQIIHADTSVLSEDFTSADYEKEMMDSGLILMIGTCTGCYGFTFTCAGQSYCLDCEFCPPNFKTVQQQCVVYQCRL